MAADGLLLRDVIGGFAPGQSLRAALMCTFSFDGAWLEEGLVPDLFDRQVATCLVLRDANALIREAPSVRYHRANAQYSTRVFHSKLLLLVADDRALAVVGSANLTRGGLERNLELGSVHEVSPEGGPRAFFQQLHAYLGHVEEKEVRGSSRGTVIDTRVALAEVLAAVPKDSEKRLVFLHNYEEPLWQQIMDQLPHRHVAKVSVVSPFFEPNKMEPEDPGLAPDDDGIFARMFGDLKLAPAETKQVTVCFQTSGSETLLPIDHLRKWEDQIELRHRLSTSDDARPLHAKLLVVEGARTSTREPYLVAVHGSPNFTTAALLSRPPDGNAEIAVLTHLPWKRDSHAQVRSALQLDELFGPVNDWTLLRHAAPPRPPLPGRGVFRLGEVTLRVADRRLSFDWSGTTVGAAKAHVLIELNGAWVSIGVVTIGAEERAELDVPMLATVDEGGLLLLQAARVRVELRDDQDQPLATCEAPINVDCPAEFCGLAMVQPMMATLDEQIAHAGCGVALTYREQLKFLEQHRTKRTKGDKAISVLTHQADLDRFFRNLHTGLRGLRTRREALPSSEYTLRRTFKDLGHWCGEAVRAESQVPTVECRVYLVDRLSRELERVLDAVDENSALTRRVRAVTTELALSSVVDAATAWARTLSDPSVAPYVAGTVKRLQSIGRRLGGA